MMFKSAHLGFEGHEFEDHLYCEKHSKDEIERVGQLGDVVRLVAVLQGEGEG